MQVVSKTKSKDYIRLKSSYLEYEGNRYIEQKK